MSFTVVAISRTVGAGGERVGHEVSQHLRFRYVDEEIVSKAAEKADVDPKLIAELEHGEGMVRRVMEALGLARALDDPLSYLIGRRPEEHYYHLTAPPKPTTSDGYRRLIRAVIVELAREGQAVIVAHAASMALKGNHSVLRVLVTASPSTRAARLSQLGGMLTEEQATVAVRESDAERHAYFHDFYDIREELPTHYDLVLNTDRLTTEQAVNVIVSTVRG
jgi:cytidylate kinase